MRRRELIAGISAAAWPVVAWGQQQRLPVVGYLNAGYSGATINFVAAFRKGLSETGFSEGRNLAIEYRFAENQFDWLPELVAELVHRQMSVIAVLGGGLVRSSLEARLNQRGASLESYSLLVGHQDLSSKVFVDLAISLPALFAGSALGVIAFHRVNETVFRKTVLVLLLISGISLI